MLPCFVFAIYEEYGVDMATRILIKFGGRPEVEVA